jgi:hypothetical protein
MVFNKDYSSNGDLFVCEGNFENHMMDCYNEWAGMIRSIFI